MIDAGGGREVQREDSLEDRKHSQVEPVVDAVVLLYPIHAWAPDRVSVSLNPLA